MKKRLGLLATIVLVLCLLFAMPVSASAASTVSQDGLDVSISTDKDKYNANEDISVSFKIKNNNSYEVEGVSLNTVLPDGFKLKSGELDKKDISISAGDTYSAEVKTILPAPSIDDATSSTGNSTTDKDAPDTGAKTFTWVILSVVVVAAVAVGIIIAIKNKKSKQVISLIICFAMILPLIPLNAFAAENDTATIAVDKTITVDGKEYKITSTVKYNSSNENTTYTVSFDLNYSGSDNNISDQKIQKSQFAIEPKSPEREGYEFIGWFTDKFETDWTKAFMFAETPIESDLELFALWVDMTTDSDQDGLSDDLENHIGTYINDTDSDDDGLNDYQEELVFNYDPLDVDSDKDALNDAKEDYDNDGITNIDELSYQTNPILMDTDNDGLNDREEINRYNTNPIDNDTDGDGADDGAEISLGTDPLTANVAFDEKAEFGNISDNQTVAVSVKTTVSGQQVGTLKIAPVAYSDNPVLSPTIPGYIDNAVDITINGSINSAELTFEYDTALGKLSDEFQPRIYYFNEETHTFDELPNQIVSDGSVSVTIEHFSTYILLNKVEFDKVWNDEIKKPIVDGSGSTASNIDVAFAIDVSGSMYGDRIKTAKSALNNFIDALTENDRAALIEFNEYSNVLHELTTDKESIKAKVSNLYADGLTSMYKGFGDAVNLLTNDNENYGYKMIVILSDGRDEPSSNYQSDYAELVKTAIDNNIIVYTVGVDSGIDTSILTKLADETGGAYYHATSSSEITDIFFELQEDTVDLTTDSNNDAIPDYYNELIKNGELVLSNGSIEFMGIDFNYNENGEPSNDYDGDGVINGEELIVKENGSRVYAVMVSDPMMQYSDSDIYDDFQEHQQGSDPMIPSYGYTYIDYPLDDSQFTYVDVLNEEDEWWNEGARQIWSSVTFNWSHEDEAKRLLVSFFDKYTDLNSIQDVTDEVTKEVASLIAENGIADISKKVKDGTLLLDDGYTEIVKALKKWKSAGNSAKNLSSDHFIQLKAQLGLFKNKYNWNSFDFKGISKLDKIGMGVSFAVDETYDVYEWINAYSAMTATQAAFAESKDILEKVVTNDDAKEKYVTKAATDILYLVNEQYQKFTSEKYKELALSTTENVGSLALSILSAANPYVMAINLVIGIIDTITPTTKIAEATYYLYVVDELVNASKSLFTYSSKESGFYNIEDVQKRHLELLICGRMYGGEFAKVITGNQHYWGLFNDDEIRQQYADAIDEQNNNLQLRLDILTK